MEMLDMKTNEKSVRMFQELVRIKRQQQELKDQYDALKEYFRKMAEDKLPGGVGQIELLQGSGVKFSTKKSSISKRKLLDQGVEESVIEAATGQYQAFEIFTG